MKLKKNFPSKEQIEIKLVSADKILLHEKPDATRKNFIKNSFEKTKFLRDPLIVTPIKKNFILLDGVNRFFALKENGISQIPCQVVNYSDEIVQLCNWDYLVGSKIKFSLENNFSEKNTGLAINIHTKNKVDKIFCKDKKHLVENINNLLGKIMRSDYTRVFDFDQRSLKPRQTLVCFPEIKKEDVLDLSLNGLKFNAGITRHIIQNRVINFCFEASFLKSNLPIEKKNSLTQKRLNKIFSGGSARKYAESVIVINNY